LEKQQFWQIIDRSAKEAGADRDSHVAALRKELEALSPDDIVGFQRCFDECMAEAYSWDLWGAAYIIGGGCSDDGFIDFRSWLISKGQDTYDRALRDSETLADVIVDTSDDCQFEEFQYVASQMWERKTRKDLSRFPTFDSEYPESPTGEEWSEEGDDLERRFPKLWKRFGTAAD